MSPRITNFHHIPYLLAFFVIHKPRASNNKPVAIKHTKQSCKVKPFQLCNILLIYLISLKLREVVIHQISPPFISQFRQTCPQPSAHLLRQAMHECIHFPNHVGIVHDSSSFSRVTYALVSHI